MNIFVAIGRFLYEVTLRYGVVGLAAGMFLESCGIPTAAAVVDLTAGLLILDRRTTFLAAVIISDLGLVLGSLTAYYLGKAGSSIFEYWHKHPPDEAERRSKSKQLIDRYGNKAIFFAQLFGPARTWISYPAGAMGMDVKMFTIYTALGGAIYCTVVITISLYLTKFIESKIDVFFKWAYLPVPAGIVLAIIFILAIRFYLRKKRSAASRS